MCMNELQTTTDDGRSRQTYSRPKLLTYTGRTWHTHSRRAKQQIKLRVLPVGGGGFVVDGGGDVVDVSGTGVDGVLMTVYLGMAR